MDKRDELGKEIKDIMEEETFDMTLSQESKDKIFLNRRMSLRKRINNFLNREIEVPLAPIIIGMAGLLVISILPKNILNQPDERVVQIGGSQVIIREGYKVGKNEDKD